MGGILVRYIKTPSNTDNQGWKGRYSTGFWKMLLEGWWKKNCGRKRCSLERTVKKNQLKNLGRLHKERTEAGISASAMKTSPCTDVFRKRAAAFTFLISGQSRSRDWVRRIIWRARKEKYCSVAEWPKVFFLDQSKLCISFEHQGPRGWRKSEVAQYPRCLKSSVKLLQCVMIWGAVSPAGVGGGRVHCVLTSPSQHSIYQEVTLFLHLLTSFMESPISLSTRTFPQCQRAWPEHHRESMEYYNEEEEKHQTSKKRWAEGFCQSNTGFNNTHWIILRHILII